MVLLCVMDYEIVGEDVVEVYIVVIVVVVLVFVGIMGMCWVYIVMYGVGWEMFFCIVKDVGYL